ncbi:3-oxoacyl-[acyl-carrier-protein] synthase 2 [compost metagenome]
MWKARWTMSARNAVRIVVTGAGVVGPLGCGTEMVWSRLLAGESGIRALPADLADGTGCAVGGQVPSLEEDPQAGYDPERIVAAKERKKMDRFIEFALAAA